MLQVPIPDILMLLAVAVVIVTAFRFLRLSPVLGYLAAGVVIGQSGSHMVRDVGTMNTIAEFGIVFLMFMIGLELSWDRLKSMRSKVFVLGTAQVVITASAFALVAGALGMTTPMALIIGCGLALSSTALVLQVLETRHEVATQTGRLALSILILQDLAVLPLLVLLPILASGQGSVAEELSQAALHACIALVGIGVVGRALMRPVFRLIARLHSEELFVATTLLVVIGAAWITQVAGLSSALGAFIAGILLAETEFRHQIEIDVKPFKSLLMGLFFMTIGMQIDVQYLQQHVLDVVLATLLILGLKSVVLFVVLRLRNYSTRTSAHVALLLAQGGEFGFILFSLTAQLGLTEDGLSEALLVAITVSMAVTPLLDSLGAWLEKRWWRRIRLTPELLEKETLDIVGHVVISGYGSMGRLLAKFLEREKIPFVVVDHSPLAVATGRREHMPVYYGDVTRSELMSAIGIERAAAIILTTHDAEQAKRMFLLMKLTYPDIPILVRTSDYANERRLLELGATVAVPELQVTSMRMIAGLLTQFGRSEEEIQRIMQSMRLEEAHAPLTSAP